MIRADEAKCCANLCHSENVRCAIIAIDSLIRSVSQNGKFDCIWRSSVLSENDISHVIVELRKNGYVCYSNISYNINNIAHISINISWK